ncbi:MAG: cytochrome c oxidase subunit II [Burkholderiales bacterium]|nr:cytochrome c oxidase subunit II [Burkholderiales bacterium]
MYNKFFNVLLLLLTTFWRDAMASYDVNIPQPDTVIAHQIYDLHLYILIVCAVIFVVVFGWMFLALLKHRKSVGHNAEQFHENTTVEILWTIIPFVILVAMAIPATRTVLEMKDVGNADMSIKVTGYQWKWEYDYQQDGVRFYSNLKTPRDQIGSPDRPATAAKNVDYLLEVDNPMVVPAGKKVRLMITSNDVIHGWYMPQLGVNQYGIPGFIKDTWINIDRPGVYKGQCSQICGKEHAYMPITVVAKSDADYKTWVAEQKQKMAAAAEDSNKTWTLADLKVKGLQVYTANCQACHQANGQGIPGSFPGLSGSKLTNGPKAGHIDIVLNGKPGTAMQAFGKQLSDTEIAAVVTYERNEWDNKTGDVIQPAEIKAARK